MFYLLIVVKQYHKVLHLVAAGVSVANTVSRRVQLSRGVAPRVSSWHSPCPPPASPQTVSPAQQTNTFNHSWNHVQSFDHNGPPTGNGIWRLDRHILSAAAVTSWSGHITRCCSSHKQSRLFHCAITFTRDSIYAIARICHANSVRLSVHLSVTCVYCIKMDERIIEILSPSDRPIILVFRHQGSLHKSEGIIPRG